MAHSDIFKIVTAAEIIHICMEFLDILEIGWSGVD
jgi:hypothetical protein